MAVRALAGALLALSSVFLAGPSGAQVAITQAKANAGNVTPGDAAGFPITISRSGSYRLVSNLTVPADKDGIEITANDVTIDFNGFVMQGWLVADTGVLGGGDTATLKNGIIAGFKSYGILGPDFWKVEDMSVLVNGSAGFPGIALQNSASIRRSTVASSGGDGVRCWSLCHIEGSVITRNGAHGVVPISGLVLGNTIGQNSGFGVWDSGNSTGDVGVGNNAFISNNTNSIGNQLRGTSDLHPNTCFGKPCR